MVQLGARRIERWCDGLLDGLVILVAAWTASYHVCLVLRLGLVWAASLAAVIATATVGLVLRSRSWPVGAEPPGPEGRPAPSVQGRLARHRPALRRVTVVAALVAAVGMAVSGPWLLVWLPWLVAAVAGAAWSAGSAAAPLPDPAPTTSSTGGRATSILVLAWTVAVALLSWWLIKPNADDVFYLNLSQWVADHGSFPLRDTLFADGSYPMTNWPPVASYDALVGAVARVTGAHAASIAYLVVTPTASALSVLALWRLLREWRVRSVALAISVALVFLLETGDFSYAAPGNLFVSRIWQGKVLLLCLLVPLLLVQALRYAERPSRAGLVRLAVAGVASVGLSTTALFLSPAVALAGMAPLALRSPRRALAGFAAAAAYPLAAGAVTVALGGHSADDFGERRLYRFDASWIGHEIFRSGPLALAAVAAVLLAPLLLSRGAARVTTAVAALIAGLVLVPGLVRVSYDVIGLGPTLWRLSWALTVAALAGVAVDRVAAALLQPSWPGLTRAASRRWTAPAVGVVAVALTVALGRPLWSSGPQAGLSAPLHWQRPPDTRTMTTQILEIARPGDLVLAPEPLSITLSITSSDVWSVSPVEYYLAALGGQPGFHERQRRTLAGFANQLGESRPAAVRHALRVLGVRIACVYADDTGSYRDLRGFGFTPAARSTSYRCLQRP